MYRPHDLLWISHWNALQFSEPVPRWIDAQWMVRMPVVVRRERTSRSLTVPVGLRGNERHERLAAYLDSSGVLRCTTPEALGQQATWHGMPYLTSLPATAALDRIAPLLNASGLAWGPTGSMGYSLATATPMLREESDLDILVRCETPFTTEETKLLRTIANGKESRIDIQVETGYGGFAFVEWIRNRGRVLIKTGTGPFLTNDPWNRTGWLDLQNRGTT